MILINGAPPQADADLTSHYQRMAAEGMVQSSPMHRQHYDKADKFEDAWRCPAITWSAGGEEAYHMDRGRTVTMRSAGALMLAADARYAYEARSEQAFQSNMIVFPKWITDGAMQSVFGEPLKAHRRFSTLLMRPAERASQLMAEIAGECRAGSDDIDWYREQIAILYDLLLMECDRLSAARARIEAEKPSTRKELARRVARAQAFILESYCDAELRIDDIAKEACLSRFHLIRVFKMYSGVTPMQFLAEVRMEAALRLFRETGFNVARTAAAVGYGNRAAFSKAFRRQFGAPPSEARPN